MWPRQCKMWKMQWSKCELLTVFYSYEWIRSKLRSQRFESLSYLQPSDKDTTLTCHTTPEQVIETPSKNTKRGGFLP